MTRSWGPVVPRSMVSEIDRDVADGSAAGVVGTPTFFVNGRALVGAQPYAVLEAAIDAELERAGVAGGQP